MPNAREVATAKQPQPPEASRPDVSANDIIKERGYWQGIPGVEPADAPQVGPTRAASSSRRPASVAIASADPVATLSSWPVLDRTDSEPMPNALAYASEATPIAARAAPMGSGTRAMLAAAPPDTTVAVKRSDERPPATPAKAKAASVVRVGDRFNDPWMRAMIVTPSAHSFMKTTLYGEPDFRNLRPHMHKPAASVMMMFSDDPHLGITSEKFAGSAVVFMSTVTFGARTALLR